MAFHKKEIFTKKEQDLAELAKALSHPARIAILKHLAQKGACTCNMLVDKLPLAQSTVSQHLNALKEAGLLAHTADGPRMYYTIDWKAWTKKTDNLQAQFDWFAARSEM